MKSIPVAVKVGSAGVLGGGGITGAGLLIHNQLQKTSKGSEYKLEGLDLELVNDPEAVLGVNPSNTEFVIGTSSGGSKPTNQVTLEIKVTTLKESNKAKQDKWICTITGIAKNSDSAASAVTLTNTPSGNFDKKSQTDLFIGKLGKDSKKVSQDGFVTSCARNRGSNPKGDSNWESTLTLNLKQDNQKWVFDGKDIEAVFKGTYTNPKQQ